LHSTPRVPRLTRPPEIAPAPRSFLLLVAGLAFAARIASAQEERVTGTTVEYKSSGGVVERCVAATPMPGGAYSETDRQTEKRYCGLDFYASTVALCPKTWSTSPGTVVYDVSAGRFAGEAARFEREVCGQGGSARRLAHAQVGIYKYSMNGAETSGTFSTSSLLYYHLSRYFHTTIAVPVAVYRSMDRLTHRARVSEKGVAITADKPASAMLHAGWTTLTAAEESPAAYGGAAEIFTADRKRIFGVILTSAGEAYGPEINGTRSSKWGDGQSRDFQETPPFIALRSEKPLRESVADGLAKARADARFKGAQIAAAEEQLVFWMRDLIDITLLDFILGQQDRIGNIDFVPYWYWVEQGAVRRAPASDATPPAEVAAFTPHRIARTALNDNDAGVRRSYLNYTARTGMLEKLRHYDAETYRRLMALDRDFAKRGPLLEYFSSTFGLTSAELGQVVENTTRAGAILRESCRAGHLRFDLDPEAFLRNGTVSETAVDCDNP
jgi:hypothetical protein